MWECPKCAKKSTNPEQHHKHLVGSPACKNQPEVFGWQGVDLDGIPKTKSGFPLKWTETL